MKKQILNPEEILKKTFSTQKKGYSPEEVDSFLDEIFESYEKLVGKLTQAKTMMIEKTDKISKLEDVVNGTKDIKANDAETFLHDIEDNVVKRMSNLEEKIDAIFELLTKKSK
jgi:DivIVA domain-containing protein